MPMNMGISAALNKGLQEAQGEYILRFDSDDRCDCDRISKQLSFLKIITLIWSEHQLKPYQRMANL